MKKSDSDPSKKNTREQKRDASSVRIPRDDRKLASAAHEQAEKDMLEDADFTASSPNDDLDEGETARLGEDKTDII
ncbi:hypothetical protein OCK74_24615 [Chitinophagaceae bacterium LB-8]|uniref:Uncharacterized protein n=1 Tax=Paraflavisolibacter caeni TaxID=2982496 RepID=A0A9X2XZK6_9BACT|nr:hypothetical protein [Paraflavisolibacter caeni]MCU7552326.1 hypothetical protein [Paraflavisolibacter caeni]